MRNRRGRPRHPDVLTPAEWGVLEGVREGCTNAEIAERLGISVNTVRYHVSNMLAKLDVGDRQAPAAWRGAPAAEHRGVRPSRAGILAVARFLGLAAGIVAVAMLAWVSLDRLSRGEGDAGSGASSATSMQPTAEATPTAAATGPLSRDASFVSGEREWARALLTTSTDTRRPLMGVLPDGSIVVAWTVGTFEAAPAQYSVDLGQGVVPHRGGTDVAIGRLAADGTPIWSQVYGGPGSDALSGLAVVDGAIYLSGAYSEGFELGGLHDVRGRTDGFLARFDADGKVEWVRTFGGPGRDGGGSLAAFPDGDLAVTASFDGSIDFLGTELVDPSARGEFEYAHLVARLSPDGTSRWLRSVNGASALMVHPATQEVVYAYGPGASLPDDAGPGGWSGIAALTAGGEPAWTAPFVGGGRASVAAFAIAPDGGIVGVGGFGSPTDFGDGEVVPDGWVPGEGNPNSGADSFAVWLEPDGTPKWSRTWGAWPLDRASAVTFDVEGLLVAGSFANSLYIEEFGRYALPLPAYPDSPLVRAGYILRFTADGEATALHVLEGGDPERIGPILAGTGATQDGEVLIGGRFFDAVEFPFGKLVSSQWLDYFIARIALR